MVPHPPSGSAGPKGVRLAALLLILLLAPAFSAGAATPTARETVTRGAELLTYELKEPYGPVRAYVLRLDLRDPYLDLRPIVGANDSLEQRQTVPAMAKRTGAVAALNGDFFYLKGSGRPIGPVVKDGRLVASPTEGENLYTFAVTTSRTPLITALKFTGRVRGAGAEFPLAGINKPFPEDPGDLLLLYTPDWGGSTAKAWTPGADIVQSVVAEGTVRQIVYGDLPVSIPAGGFVLAGSGAAGQFLAQRCPPGTSVTVEWHLTPDLKTLRMALGGYGLLVRAGQPAGSYPPDLGGRAARSAVGFSRDGRYVYLVAVEKGPASAGMTLAELADFLVGLDVWEALNLDGGGSTTLVARPLGETDPVPVNHPQAGTWRAVPNALGVYSTAPRGRPAGLVVHGPAAVVAGSYATYTATGYDEYFNPYPVEAEEIRWTTEPTSGEWRGNTFYARRGGWVTVRAAALGCTGSLTVEVLGPEKLSGLVVEPSTLALPPGGQVTLRARVRAEDGRTFDLPPDVVAWEVPAELGRIEGDLFTAAPRVTAGTLTARFATLTTRVPVSIGTSEKIAGPLEPDRPLTLELGDVAVSFPAGALKEPGLARLTLVDPPARLEGFEPLAALRLELEAAGAPATPAKPWTLTWRRPGETERRPVLGFLNRQSLDLLPAFEIRNSLKAKGFRTGTLVLAVSLRPVPAWEDLRGHWAQDTIEELAAQGIVTGFPDGTFQPQQPVTRAQLVTLLARAFNWPYTDSAPAFRDPIPQWAASAVAQGVAMGVVTGYEDQTFRPHRSVTRAELAALFARALPLPQEESLPYRDAADIPSWARQSVARLTAAGLLQGREGAYWPAAPATRAEAAALLQRVLRYRLGAP